eukprot:scpid59708/ scgid19464/ 
MNCKGLVCTWRMATSCPVSVLFATLVLLSLARIGSVSAQNPEAEIDYSAFNAENVHREHCPLQDCFTRLSYCWFRRLCACDKNDSACVAQCALCLDETWFSCCPCTGLCARDGEAKKLKRIQTVRLDKNALPKTYVVGGYTLRNRNKDRGLLEAVAASVEMLGLKRAFATGRTVSLGRLGVSIRNNTKPAPTATTTQPPTVSSTTAAEGNSESSHSSAAASTTDPSAPTTGAEVETTSTDSQNRTMIFADNATMHRLHRLEREKLGERIAEFQSACRQNQCVTIYTKMAVTRAVCWQICDTVGARTWHHWSTYSCECRSACCRRPAGHLIPLHREAL